MHFEFALELSNIYLWNIDLLGTHLDFLDTDIPRKCFFFVSIMFPRILQGMSSRYLQDMSSRLLQDMPSRRFEDVFSLTIFRLPRRLGRRKIVTLKTCWRRLQDMFWRHLEDVFKTNKYLLGLVLGNICGWCFIQL